MGFLSGLAIAGNLLSRSLFSHLIVIHSLKDLYGSSIALGSLSPSLITQLIVYSDAVEIRADFFN